MTILGLHKKYAGDFKSILDAELLIAGAIKRSKEFLYLHQNYTLNSAELRRFRTFIRDYKAGYSIAAILGHKEFYGCDFFVNKQVLVPRPETELIVDEVIEKIKEQGTRNKEQIVLIDVGTGSGCIPISIIKATPHQNITTIAVDISPTALRVAKKNASIHKAKINFIQGNLLQPILKNNLAIQQFNNSSILITANLPYLTTKQFQDEPSIQREPKLALVAEHNGLALYEQLCQQISILSAEYPSIEIRAWFEIDPSQNNRIQKVVKRFLPTATTKIITDLSGRDRVCEIVVPKSANHFVK